jgi:hypothetical protein
MEKKKKVSVIVVLAAIFCFVFVFSVQAKNGNSIPIWQIKREGTSKSVKWITHTPNPRFAIYDAGTNDDETDDLVLDKETGLIWERSPGSEQMNWYEAIFHAYSKCLGGRMGWRLPTIEELASLVNPIQGPPRLPNGHPFINVPTTVAQWTSTTRAADSNTALRVDFAAANYPVGWGYKNDNNYVWCVRGGKGHDAY